MPNLENYLTFSHWQYDVVRHLLQLTVASFLAGLVYFAMSTKDSAPRFRTAAIISAVVMVSAALEVGQLALLWSSSFTYDGARWVAVEGQRFSNGFRYINWSIDVPMLLAQLLIVLGLSGGAFWRTWWPLAVAGLLMVWTGYVGQFYEPQIAGLAPGDGAPFWIWFAVSCVPFLFVLVVVGRLTAKPPEPLDPRSAGQLRLCWWILLSSWLLYPIAYALPALWPTAEGMVLRQGVYTAADITSKLIFGVALSRLARFRSRAEGWTPAQVRDDEFRVRAPVVQSDGELP